MISFKFASKLRILFDLYKIYYKKIHQEFAINDLFTIYLIQMFRFKSFINSANLLILILRIADCFYDISLVT